MHGPVSRNAASCVRRTCSRSNVDVAPGARDRGEGRSRGNDEGEEREDGFLDSRRTINPLETPETMARIHLAARLVVLDLPVPEFSLSRDRDVSSNNYRSQRRHRRDVNSLYTLDTGLLFVRV